MLGITSGRVPILNAASGSSAKADAAKLVSAQMTAANMQIGCFTMPPLFPLYVHQIKVCNLLQ